MYFYTTKLLYFRVSIKKTQWLSCFNNFSLQCRANRGLIGIASTRITYTIVPINTVGTEICCEALGCAQGWVYCERGSRDIYRTIIGRVHFIICYTKLILHQIECIINEDSSLLNEASNSIHTKESLQSLILQSLISHHYLGMKKDVVHGVITALVVLLPVLVQCLSGEQMPQNQQLHAKAFLLERYIH